ncbi:hypothetical protein OIU78_023961 [Salix suchowensis]|nr:hypothetical protein OIU78_023961 [Salix suchowensis]
MLQLSIVIWNGVQRLMPLFQQLQFTKKMEIMVTTVARFQLNLVTTVARFRLNLVTTVARFLQHLGQICMKIMELSMM